MALICPVCSTENRGGANFCRSCGVKLPAAGDRIPPPPSPEREWAATAPAQLRAPTIPAPLFDPDEPLPARGSFFGRSAARQSDEHEQTVLMVHDDELPRTPAPPASPPGLESTWAPKSGTKRRSRAKVRQSVPAERPPRKRVILLWLGLLVVAVAMIVAGWSGNGTRKTPAAAEEATATAIETPAPVAPSSLAEPSPAAPEPQPAEPAVTPPAVETAPAAAAAPKPATKPRNKQAITAALPSNAPEPAAVVAAPAPAPAPVAAAEPQAMCGDRNFIAKAQCMAAQCLKPEFKAHAQCEAVRRQQRIEEEKRNPTLIN
ncbi:zinc ribbon domain-containing protein [Variovorax sp. 2RAF20]